MIPRLEVRRATKQFPGVLANDDVNFSVAPGEIHALLGDNGAGKSTLVKLIYGVLHPDSGDILWNGTPARIDDPRAARKLGIGMVFQHFSLFETLRKIAGEGCSILYISHKLPEIKALCDRATILRSGRVVAECDPRTETTAAMAQMMIGEELTSVERRAGETLGEARLVVEGLFMPSEDIHGVDLRNLAFTVRAGEIFGIAGIAGNGQSELLQALSGERLATRSNEIRVAGQAVGHLGTGARRDHGVCVIPEERNGHGAAAGAPGWEQ